jgi:hypothetical protein
MSLVQTGEIRCAPYILEQVIRKRDLSLLKSRFFEAVCRWSCFFPSKRDPTMICNMVYSSTARIVTFWFILACKYVSCWRGSSTGGRDLQKQGNQKREWMKWTCGKRRCDHVSESARRRLRHLARKSETDMLRRAERHRITPGHLVLVPRYLCHADADLIWSRGRDGRAAWMYGYCRFNHRIRVRSPGGTGHGHGHGHGHGQHGMETQPEMWTLTCILLPVLTDWLIHPPKRLFTSHLILFHIRYATQSTVLYVNDWLDTL